MKKKNRLPLISVIIPTFNRAELLRLSLGSLTRQTLPKKDFEVIVVDDGSSDHTRQVCREMEKTLPLRYVFQANSGISTAKNLGVFMAQAPLLFFFDDDDVADRNLLKEHLRSHREHPEENVAILGYTTWDPSLDVTPVMHYVMDVGQFLFAYKHLRDGQQLDYTYFWGGRSSCKRSLLVRHGVFRQQFRFGSEDIELSWRLSKFGFKVFFNRRAVSYMVRPITYAEFCRRCEKQGRSQHWFHKAHPHPVIREYCMISKAEEKWRFIKPRLDEKAARVSEIETLIASHEGTAPQALLDELYNLYGWTFNAFKIKGIVEESRAGRTLDEPSSPALPQVGVPAADLRVILERGRSLSPLKEKEGILVCDPLLPMFDRASGSLRLFHILKALVGLGYHVTFISRDSDYAERYAPILRDLGIETYAGDPSAKEHAGALIIAPFVDLEDILRRRPYRAAILSFWHLAEYYLPLIRRYSPDTTVIVDSVDIHFLREMREAELKKDARLLEKAQDNRQRELRVYSQADRVWVVTPDDRKAIESLIGDVPVDVIPNIHEKIEHRKAFDETSDLLFVGNFNHRPNIDAVHFFCGDILPLLQKRLPGIKTYIVGNNPPEEVRRYGSSRVIVTGYVEDLAPYLKEARISISPLRYGAGMKGKVGEALSWGLPVVTTSIGAEGMGLVDGHDAMIADDPVEFSEKVARLYNDAGLWTRLSTNGRETVESQWSPDAIRKRISAVLQEIARKRERVSIIILTFNEMEYTKRCVESIRRHTPEPHEIIFVDNGSKDGTVQWLRELVKQNSHVKLIENGRNLGFAKGCNQGIEAAAGDFILLLNNDTVVTEGWLAGMLECLHRMPDAGIVGPMTNHISGIQRVETVDYDSIDGLDVYARAFRQKNRRRCIEARRLVGFCMLFRKDLVDKIGPLDESFGTGNFEDDDFCARAALAGYRNAIAGDVFIHHFGSRSFIGNRIDYGAALAKNRKRYADKWQALERKAEEGGKIRSLVAREKAQEQFLRGDVQGAVDLWLAAIRHLPGDHRAYHELADGLIRTKRFRDALDVLNEVPAGPASAERLVLEGRCREGLDDLDTAEQMAVNALSARANCPSALNLRGVVAFRRGAADEARSFFGKAAEAGPSWGEPLTNLGVLAWAEGRHEEALELLEKGFTLTPRDSDLAERYHAAAASLGLQARAEKVFREARGLYPASRTIAFLLIDLLIAQEKHAAAMAEIEAAMAAFEVDDGFIDAALEVRRKLGPMAIGDTTPRPALSLCMIVRNEQSNLVRCLSSVKAAVDEIIVVDTGSTDRTKDLAAVFGARVFDFAWTDDFSRARNFSLSKAQGDWILVLDADETISPADHRRLRDLIRKSPKKIGGYDLATRNYVIEANTAGWTANDGSYPGEEAGTGWYANRKVRLFRNDSRIRFSGAVHELVEASMAEAKMKIAVCDVPVHHTGKLDRARVTEKGERYFELGMKKIEETGGTPRSVLELAVQAGELGRWDDAVDLWRRFLRGKPGHEVNRAYVNLINACLNADRFDEALAEARKAETLANGTRELALNCAAAEFFAGDLRKAASMAQRLLQKHADYPPALGLLAMSLCLTGQEERSLACMQRLQRQGLDTRSQLLPAVAKLRVAGKDEQADRLQDLLERHFPGEKGCSGPAYGPRQGDSLRPPA